MHYRLWFDPKSDVIITLIKLDIKMEHYNASYDLSVNNGEKDMFKRLLNYLKFVNLRRIDFSKMYSLFFLSFLLVPLGGCGIQDNILYQLSSSKRASAIQNMAVLKSIHEGDSATAISYLDLCIDSAVLESFNRLQQFKGNMRKEEVKFLKKIKEFRQKFPRTLSNKSDSEIMKERQEIISKVEEILEGI